MRSPANTACNLSARRRAAEIKSRREAATLHSHRHPPFHGGLRIGIKLDHRRDADEDENHQRSDLGNEKGQLGLGRRQPLQERHVLERLHPTTTLR